MEPNVWPAACVAASSLLAGGLATVSGYLLLDAVNGGVLTLQVYRRDLDYVRFVRFRY